MACTMDEIPDFHPNFLIAMFKSILVFLHREDRGSVSVVIEYSCWPQVLNNWCSAIFGIDVDDLRSDDEDDEDTKKD
jgi:hypothetical protein